MAGSSSSIDATNLTSILLNAPTVEEDALYYTKLCSELGGKIEVRPHSSLEKGKGLFATEAISQGDIIFLEKPLISIQDVCKTADVVGCAQCLRHAGGFEDQLYWYLLTKDSLSTNEEILKRQLEDQELKLPRFEDQEMQRSTAKRCSAAKHASNKQWTTGIACSVPVPLKCEIDLQEICEWVRPGTSINKEALAAFEEFCEETNHSFYLVAKALSRCLYLAIQSTDTNDARPIEALQKAWEPLRHAWRPLWRDCLRTPEDVEDTELFQSELQSDALTFTSSLHFPRDLVSEVTSKLQLSIKAPPVDGIIHPKIVEALMGMIDQNDFSIVVPSPLEQYIDRLNAADDELVASLWDRYPALKETIIHAAQLQLQGSGYYRVACCANHSCRPNAIISNYRTDINVGHVLVLYAARDINPGEEVTLSYIDEDVPYDVRCQQLRDYGFVCDCLKCTAER